MILSAQSIRDRAPISPLHERKEGHVGTLRNSYGLGPAGYDLRLAEVDVPVMGHVTTPRWRIPPGKFVLASAMEYFTMPDDLIAFVHDKSTWVRRGLTVQNSVVEPGWMGYLTLELKNISAKEVILERGCGICQVVFHELDAATESPYSGKYQKQGKKPQKAK